MGLWPGSAAIVAGVERRLASSKGTITSTGTKADTAGATPLQVPAHRELHQPTPGPAALRWVAGVARSTRATRNATLTAAATTTTATAAAEQSTISPQRSQGCLAVPEQLARARRMRSSLKVKGSHKFRFCPPLVSRSMQYHRCLLWKQEGAWVTTFTTTTSSNTSSSTRTCWNSFNSTSSTSAFSSHPTTMCSSSGNHRQTCSFQAPPALHRLCVRVPRAPAGLGHRTCMPGATCMEMRALPMTCRLAAPRASTHRFSRACLTASNTPAC